MESLRADSVFSRGYPETTCARGGALQGRCERVFRAGRAGCRPALALQPPGTCDRADPRDGSRAIPVPAAAPRTHHLFAVPVDKAQITYPLEHCHVAADRDLVGAGWLGEAGHHFVHHRVAQIQFTISRIFRFRLVEPYSRRC